MYQLYSVPHPTGGEQTDHGEWPTLRMATEVARAIQKADPSTPRYFSASDPDERIDHPEVGIVGVTHSVQLEPPAYSPDVELTLRDGRVVWLSDLERELRAARANPSPTGDVIAMITTNGCGKLMLEGQDGTVYAERELGDRDDPEEYAEAVHDMALEAERKAYTA